jgi:hypothetical protein
MAFYLYKLIRRKIRENEARKAVATTEESHLVPELTPLQEQQQKSNKNAEHGVDVPIHDHVHKISVEEAAHHKAEARKRHIRQVKLMLGLALPNFLASIDVTIVAPAIPIISSHFSMKESITHSV